MMNERPDLTIDAQVLVTQDGKSWEGILRGLKPSSETGWWCDVFNPETGLTWNIHASLVERLNGSKPVPVKLQRTERHIPEKVRKRRERVPKPVQVKKLCEVCGEPVRGRRPKEGPVVHPHCREPVKATRTPQKRLRKPAATKRPEPVRKPEKRRKAPVHRPPKQVCRVCGEPVRGRPPKSGKPVHPACRL